MRLTELKSRQIATIKQVRHQVSSNIQKDPIATRLVSLGFIVGEPIEIIAHGLFGREPILVKVGQSRFALRQNEADRIDVEL